jgi:hypothetical protein
MLVRNLEHLSPAQVAKFMGTFGRDQHGQEIKPVGPWPRVFARRRCDVILAILRVGRDTLAVFL